MQVKQEQLEQNMEQWTGVKLGNEYIKACILSLCLFNLYARYIMWNAWLDKAQAGSRLHREISTTSHMQMIPP